MTTVLYYSRNPNPRLAVATARHLNAGQSFEWADPFDGLNAPLLAEVPRHS